MKVFKEKVVLPGDKIEIPSEADLKSKNESILAGPGLKFLPDKSALIATQCGILRQKINKSSGDSPQAYWIDTHAKRYIPAPEDRVIGIVTQKHTENWKLDIGSADLANLSWLAFENMTKKNKPTFPEGTAVYARLETAIKDMEPELSCVEADGRTRGLGPLPDGGFVFRVSLDTVRKILSPSCPFLELLGKEIRFEITCGLNGRIWLKAGTLKETIAVSNCVSGSQFIAFEEMRNYVRNCVDKMRCF